MLFADKLYVDISHLKIPFSIEEIKLALLDYRANKALG